MGTNGIYWEKLRGKAPEGLKRKPKAWPNPAELFLSLQPVTRAGQNWHCPGVSTCSWGCSGEGRDITWAGTSPGQGHSQDRDRDIPRTGQGHPQSRAGTFPGHDRDIPGAGQGHSWGIPVCRRQSSVQQAELFPCSWLTGKAPRAAFHQKIILPEIGENNLDPIKIPRVGRGRGAACSQRLQKGVLRAPPGLQEGLDEAPSTGWGCWGQEMDPGSLWVSAAQHSQWGFQEGQDPSHLLLLRMELPPHHPQGSVLCLWL